MQIAMRFVAVSAAALVLLPVAPGLAQTETPEQAKARAALAARLRQMESQPAQPAPAKTVPPKRPQTAQPPVKPMTPAPTKLKPSQESPPEASATTVGSGRLDAEQQARLKAALEAHLAEPMATPSLGRSSTPAPLEPATPSMPRPVTSTPAKMKSPPVQRQPEMAVQSGASARLDSEKQALLKAALDARLEELNKEAARTPPQPQPVRKVEEVRKVQTTQPPVNVHKKELVKNTEPPPRIQPAVATQVSATAPPKVHPVSKTEFQALPAPELPLSAEKQRRLDALLRQYQADQITPEQYHEERAKILAEP